MSSDSAITEDIITVNAPTRDVLNDRQLVDSKEYKADLIQWLSHFGKKPEKAEGYIPSTVRQV